MSYTLDFPIQYIANPDRFATIGLGELYIGVVDGDPAAEPADRVQAYIARQNDTDLAIPQPIELSAGGVPTCLGSPVTLKINQSFSVAVLNSNGAQIYYSPKAGEIIDEINNLSVQVAEFAIDVAAAVKYAATIADASALTGLVADQQISVAEYNAGTGVGGGMFVVEAGSVTPNNVTTFASATGGVYFHRINTERPTVEMGGAVTGTDSTVAFQRCLDSGLVCAMADGSVYKISSRLTWTQPNSGFVCDGMSRIEMLRASFSQATYVAAINTINCGLYASGIDKPILKGVLINLEAGAGIRTAIACAISNCTNIDFERTHAYGYSEPEFGVFTCDSSTGKWIDGYVYDCTSSSSTLPSLQITGFEIDENRVAGAYSQISGGVWRFKNLQLTGAAVTTYGFQTDGLTLSGGATSDASKGCVFDAIITEDVDESADIQSANNYIGAVIAKNVGAYGLKLVHAARNNRVDFVSIDQSRSFGVVFAGTATASQNCRGNSVGRVVTKGIGSLPDVGGAPGSPLARAAVGFDGGSAPLTPSDNVVESVSCYDNSAMAYAVQSEAGARNEVKDIYCDGEPATSRFTVLAPHECKVSFRDYTDAKYVVGRYYGGEVLNTSSTTPVALSANTLYAVPFIVRESTQFGAISFHVTTSAAGNARLGVYRVVSGVPSLLVKDIGTVSTSTTGLKEISSAIVLPEGRYCLAIVTDVGISIYGSAANVDMMNFVGVTNVGNAEIVMSRAFTFGALPSAFGAVAYASGTIPNIFLRRT